MSKLTKAIVGGVIIILLVLGAMAATGNDKSDILTIGSIAGSTGEYAAVGQEWQRGVALAHVLHQNSSDAIDVEIITADSEWDTRKGVTAYKKLENVNSIDALLNLGTFTMNGIYEEVKTKPYPVLQGGEQSIDPVADNVFQVMPGSIAVEKELGEHVAQEDYDNIALFRTQDATFEKFAAAFTESYGSEVDEYVLASDTNDFRTQATKALRGNPDAIVILAFPTQGAQLLNNLDSLTDEIPPLYFDVTFSLSEYEDVLRNDEMLEGTTIMSTEQNFSDEFVEVYKQKYGKEPALGADWGFDAYNSLVNNYDQDGRTWIENLRGTNFSGAGGYVQFDDVGVRSPKTALKTVENGTVVSIESD